ncbi:MULTISPECIES: protoheme IX farnesyltransferase [Halolamina]|uniref:Protoheme IX farnesyltransferase n=1 Tax=Halolamina pelagica TaxID=699431 RepID=A0A1I5NM04_9EURY|nr:MULTISPECIES: protoheme IX farnesyltransferase [Halolamina]NHX36379.1 protoheme IX farnesyltransferase [Halolamina sp. R1-12]SFP22670.1 protoheme IX farnesyltransferase [Halolamina pelagica]
MDTELPTHLWSLVKPRIVTLLSVTGAFSLLAAGGASVATLAGFVVAGACVAASAAAWNCWYDRHLDRHMERTADRPLPSGRLDHRVAAGFAATLLLIGTAVGLALLPARAVVYMLLGFAAYVGLYTVALKRRHWLGVVLGGSAGSFPVLAGWTAVRPLTVEPILMALVVFAWTPAHAWALGYVYRDEFASVDVPTLPVVVSTARVQRGIRYAVWSTVATVAAVVPFAGPPYAVTAALGSALFVVGFRPFLEAGTERAAVRAFFTSNLFLAVLFAAWGVGGVAPGLSPWSQLLSLAAVPALFVGMWTARPSLRGVPSSVGGEWRPVTDRLSAGMAAFRLRMAREYERPGKGE